MRNLPQESGQALLLVLLSMAVILTVVLSIIARSVTDINITTREEQSLRAFSAAEAGIEKVLIVGSGVSGQLGEASFNAQVTGAASAVSEFVYPVGLTSGESQTIWFANHVDLDGDGKEDELGCTAQKPCFTGSKIKVCWGADGTQINSATPAIEVSVFYTSTPGDYSTTKIARVTADPYSDRRSVNHFDQPDAGTCTVAGQNFAFQKTIDFPTVTGIPDTSSAPYRQQNGLQFAKVRIFYNTELGSDIGVTTNIPGAGNSLLPPQGMNIESTGTSGDANRKVEVFQGYGEAPLVFDSALYTPNGISKGTP